MTLGIQSVPELAPPDRSRTSQAWAAVAAATLAVTATIQIVLLMIRPWGRRNHLAYDDVEPIRDRLWTGNLVASLTFCVLAFALGLVVCSLARGRGSVPATVGTLVVVVGGALFAMGSLALSTFVWYATGPGISEAAGRGLMADGIGAVGHPKASLATWPSMIGYFAFSLGSLLLFAALLRSRTVPWWLPLSLVLATIAVFVVPAGRAQDFGQIALMALLTVLAGFALPPRRATHGPSWSSRSGPGDRRGHTP